jgi:threonyl-tRNA synthetase
MRYSEQLAKQIFANNPALATENEILDEGYRVTKEEISKAVARALFNYDEDFQGDFIDDYKSLQGVKP